MAAPPRHAAGSKLKDAQSGVAAPGTSSWRRNRLTVVAMREQFAWYLNSSAAAARDAWETAILTVDTNVLLDLYRYHTKTCESILLALESFGGRVWLSHQAATEFFRNRRTVISSSEKTFRDAGTGLDDLDKALAGGLSKLRAHRLIPAPTLDDLGSSIAEAITTARESLAGVTAEHPKYLEEDPVLERLLTLFDGRVGPPPDEETLVRLLAEGKRRHDAQIPPGYKDDKDGDRSFGDYLLWSETIEFAKTAATPIIMVTSERKEDWWHRESGKTLGPRQELLEEFWRATGRPIFLYQTENFFRLANERAGKKVSEETVADIKSLGIRRAHNRSGVLNAANVRQSVSVAESDSNHGVLEIELQREVQNLTSSGRFEPELDDVPALAASVISSPDGCPPLRVAANTGTNFDFNVHLRPDAGGTLLPIGIYRVDYSAVCLGSDEVAGFEDDLEPVEVAAERE